LDEDDIDETPIILRDFIISDSFNFLAKESVIKFNWEPESITARHECIVPNLSQMFTIAVARSTLKLEKW